MVRREERGRDRELVLRIVYDDRSARRGLGRSEEVSTLWLSSFNSLSRSVWSTRQCVKWLDHWRRRRLRQSSRSSSCSLVDQRRQEIMGNWESQTGRKEGKIEQVSFRWQIYHSSQSWRSISSPLSFFTFQSIDNDSALDRLDTFISGSELWLWIFSKFLALLCLCLLHNCLFWMIVIVCGQVAKISTRPIVLLLS